MSGQARMRASYIQDNLAAVEACSPDVQRRLFAAIPETIDEIRSAARVDWLPIGVDVVLTRTVCELTGFSGVRDWSRRAFLSAVQGPMLRPIVRAVVSLFGLTPATVLRRAPMGWQQIYQGCGLLVVVPMTPDHMCLRIEGANGPFLENQCYVEGTCGTFEGAVDLGGARGTVEAHVDAAAKRVEFDVRW
ncbi:MAG: hypothetical protein HYS27_17860 [Deltaproteobacteria bacterium]|nr:hypothetical protein [Deltaproteobacteria bacterium]